MKLVRFGEPGKERPGVVDADGGIRSLAALVDDVAPSTLAPDTIRRLAAIDPFSLPSPSAASPRAWPRPMSWIM